MQALLNTVMYNCGRLIYIGGVFD